MTMTRNTFILCVGLFTIIVPSTLLFVSLNMFFYAPVIAGLICVFLAGSSVVLSNRIIGWAIIACLLSVVGPFAFAAYCNRNGAPIEIVVPAGFSGEFSIVKDHNKGEDMLWRDGGWHFIIPPSGVLLVKDDYPFYMWHSEFFVDTDGKSIVAEALPTNSGIIQTGPGAYKSSTEYDGTTHRWKIADAVSKKAPTLNN
jgi:hypothetical protein